MSTLPERATGEIDGPQLADITAGIVSLYRRHYGKGPTKAKTQMVADTVICELEDFSTPVEKTLVRLGEHAYVRELRLKFQDAMEDEFTELVEQVTRRKVRAFMSQTVIDPELALEIFLLEPRPDGFA
jgi:uncharacterized protein YbcI